jgi:uncharacterized membrane protein YozB (DUF420 family)
MLTFIGLIPPLMIFWGFVQRYRRQTHVPIMIAAILADIGVVIAVEVERHVLQRTSAGGLYPLLRFHIFLALLSFAMYFVAAYTGWRIWKGTGGRRLHRANGVILLGVRSMVSITSAMIAYGV